MSYLTIPDIKSKHRPRKRMLPIPRRDPNLHRARRIIIQTDDAGLEDADLKVDVFALGDVDGGAAEVFVAVELLSGRGEDPCVG